MKMKLVYNPATGVWMPAPEMRPKEHQFAQPQPLLRDVSVRTVPVPPMPALPLRPTIRMSALNPEVSGPQFRRIPNRPVSNQPRYPTLPPLIRQRAKFGQITVTDTLPNPDILPKATLPNLAQYNAANIKAGQQRIEQQMRTRRPGFPYAPPVSFRPKQGIRLRTTDLALNSTRGSNSRLLGFGSHLGRTLEQPFGVLR